MVGDYNQSLVLDAVRRAPNGLSQVELIELTGLSKQTVSNITRRLLDGGWFKTHGVTVTGRGKPRTVIKLDTGRRFAIGVHLDPALVTCVLLDLGGNTLAIRRVTDLLDDHPRESIRRIADLVESMIDESAIDPSRIIGVGIASPGPLDLAHGVVNPPNLFGWEEFNITAASADAFAYPVIVDKDTLVMAAGECWARDHSDGESLLFMYLGTGIGCAMAVGGTVVRGVSHNAGEIGHLITDVHGTRCHCGRRGCLGRATDPFLLLVDAAESGILAPPDERGYEAVQLGLAELCRVADQGALEAQQLLRRAADAVAEATRMLVAANGIELVVFGGPFWSTLSDSYLPIIQDHVASAPECLPHLPRVEGTVMGDAVGAVGAAYLVFDEAFSTRLSAYQLAR